MSVESEPIARITEAVADRSVEGLLEAESLAKEAGFLFVPYKLDVPPTSRTRRYRDAQGGAMNARQEVGVPANRGVLFATSNIAAGAVAASLSGESTRDPLDPFASAGYDFRGGAPSLHTRHIETLRARRYAVVGGLAVVSQSHFTPDPNRTGMWFMHEQSTPRNGVLTEAVVPILGSHVLALASAEYGRVEYVRPNQTA